MDTFLNINAENDVTANRNDFIFQNKPIPNLYKTPLAYRKYSCTAKMKTKEFIIYESYRNSQTD